LCASAVKPALEKVVDAGRPERPGQQPAEAGSKDLRRCESRGGPCANAAAAGDELAECLVQVATLDRILVSAVCLALDEGRADEARHFVACKRPALNVATESTARSRAVWHYGSRSSNRLSAPAAASPPANVPVIAAYDA
jgi:hypothetical protein